MRHVFVPFTGLVCIALSTAPGCKSNSENAAPAPSPPISAKAPAPRPAPPALDIEWVDVKTSFVEKFKVKGSPNQTGEASIQQNTYEVTLYGFPRGTKWSALDKNGVTDSASRATINAVDITEKLGAVPLDQAKQRDVRLDPEASMTLELPNGAKTEIKLPPARVGPAVYNTLKQATTGPVLFGKEPPDEKPMQSIIIGWAMEPEIIGNAKMAKDIDAVAISTQLADVKGTKKCTGYTGGKGDITLQLKETELVIYERRTGKQMAKKTFPPDQTCPKFAIQDNKGSANDSSIPVEAMRAWLKTQVKP